MNDIAIQFLKINLGDDWFVFNPIGVIVGDYDKESNVFYSEIGMEYYPINGSNIYADNYFYNPISLEELEEHMKEMDCDDISDMLAYYYNVLVDNFYIGQLNLTTGFIDLLGLSFYNIREKFSINATGLTEKEAKEAGKMFKSNNNIQSIEYFEDNTSKPKMTLNLETLKKWSSLNSLEEIKSSINNTIKEAEDIKEQFDNFNEKGEIKKQSEFKLEYDTSYTILGIEEGVYEKEELLKIVALRIGNIKKENMNEEIRTQKIDNILGAYNDIIKEQKQYKKRKNH